MYLIIRQSDDVISSSITYINKPEELPNMEQEYSNHGYYMIEIPDDEYTSDMIGAIFNNVFAGSPTIGSPE